MVKLFVFWFLVLVLVGVLILLLTHCFGKKVYNTTEKIYKSFSEEEKDEKIIEDERNKEV